MTSSVILGLGEFRFSVDTAAHQTMKRTTEYRWAAQERLRSAPAHQFIGQGMDTIELEGTIYPEYRGGFGQIAAMRALAGGGKPLHLVSGLGENLGQWCIVNIEETATVRWAGLPDKQDFKITLKAFGGDL